MEDIKLIIAVVIFFLVLFIVYSALIRSKRLTNYQENNRWDLIAKQGIILVIIASISFGIDYLSRLYLYPFYNSFQFKNIELDRFILIVFAIFTAIFTLLNLRIKKNIASFDYREVDLQQEATFFNIKPKAIKSGKKIKDYAHYFSGLVQERSLKDYSVISTKLNINTEEVLKFKMSQEDKEIVMDSFYNNLIKYVNSKSDNFNFKKISTDEIENLKNLLELKQLIFNKFKFLNQAQYFASISQLYQIANADQRDFLSFLRDSQHGKFSTLSLKHASLFLLLGEIK